MSVFVMIDPLHKCWSHLPLLFSFLIFILVKFFSAVLQTGVEKNLFGNHPVSLVATESRGPPPAFASDPLIAVSSTGGMENNARPLVLQDEISVAEGYSAATGAGSSRDILEIDGPSTAGNFVKTSSPVGVEILTILRLHKK